MPLGRLRRGQQSAHAANYARTANRRVLGVESGSPETTEKLRFRTTELIGTWEISLCEITYKTSIEALLKIKAEHLECTCCWTF